MSVALEIIRLAPKETPAAAALQGRAFFDDPAMVFTFPDDEVRRARLPWLMEIGIALGARFGHVDTSAGDMLGHAVWLRPGDTTLTPERLEQVGFSAAPRRMGEQGLERFNAFMALASEVHELLVPGPHWYLMILGVDPPHQGKGYGSALIRPTLTRADADALPCYLETTKERNVAFYRRHGFEVAHEADVAGGGPHVWMMKRQPRLEV